MAQRGKEEELRLGLMWVGRIMVVLRQKWRKKEDVYRHTKEEGNSIIRLVVDLNIDHVANGKTKSNYMDLEQYKVTEMNNHSEDPSAPVLDGQVKNAAIHLNSSEIGNLSSKIIEQRAYDDKAFKQNPHIEKEGEFQVSDLVWGKVPSHPWWPGQIYDPSASSKMALKYKKKDCFLIAYFGDQTFAWNDSLRIKPFRMYFSQMEKQSNVDSFTHAVSCALEEVSRRVEYGLSCSCLPKEVLSKIESQYIVNAGIRKDSGASFGGDSFSTAASFVPAKLVYYLKELAENPFDTTDSLEFVTARAQLLAFNRQRGYAQLPSFRILNGLLEDDDCPIYGGKKDPNESTDYAVIATNVEGKGNFTTIQDSSSGKHKHGTEEEGVRRRKKRKCVSMSENCLDAEDYLEEKAHRKNVSSSNKKRSVVDFIDTDSRKESGKGRVSPEIANNTLLSEKLFKVGDRIRKVASQLSGSASVLRFAESTSQNAVNKKEINRFGSFGVLCSSSEEAPRVNMEKEYSPIDEMLLHLSLVAVDPMKGGYNKLTSMISFFSDFRNSICLENSNSEMIHQLTSEKFDKHTINNSPDAETGFKGIEDFYSMDKIIKGTPGEQVLYEPRGEKEMPSVETEAALHASKKSDYIAEQSHVNIESAADKTGSYANEEVEKYTPTVFILNFTDLESIPSEENLNKIFSRHGPLIESDTEVLKKSNRAKVVFKRRADAETAFSSTGKFSIFGPSLVSYRLNYSPSPRKPSTPGTKRKRNDATSVKGKEHCIK